MQNRIRCSRCDQRLDPECFYPSQRQEGNWCRECRQANDAKRNAPRPRDCRICGVSFTRWDNCEHPGSAANRCQPCYREYVRKRKNPKPKRQRLTDEEFEASLAHLPAALRLKRLRSSTRWNRLRDVVIAEETHCGICGERVDKTLSGLDRMGPTGDHITPVDLGGAFFDRSNVQLAHRSCNSKAGRRLQDLRLTTYANAGAWLGARLSSLIS